MELFTKEQREKLLENGRANAGRDEPHDFMPVVRLHARWSREIWLQTEIDPDNPDLAYGLYDSGRGLPVLGPIDLAPLYVLSGSSGEHILRDDCFQPTRALSTYARLVRIAPRKKA